VPTAATKPVAAEAVLSEETAECSAPEIVDLLRLATFRRKFEVATFENSIVINREGDDRKQEIFVRRVVPLL
jgi:hypothetical protein